ncbi:MAG: hypothetical protein SFT91_03905 [Rickettsiaceae bacterium]|nr:hypothetical protein [Rickettsiaceae bacterium]
MCNIDHFEDLQEHETISREKSCDVLLYKIDKIFPKDHRKVLGTIIVPGGNEKSQELINNITIQGSGFIEVVHDSYFLPGEISGLDEIRD